MMPQEYSGTGGAHNCHRPFGVWGRLRPRVDAAGALWEHRPPGSARPLRRRRATRPPDEEAHDEDGQVVVGRHRLDARHRGHGLRPDRRDRVLAVHLRPARAGDRRAHQALRGGESQHQGQADHRALRRLPAEDRRGDPGRAGARRGPALLRLAPGLPEGEAPPAAAGGDVPGRPRSSATSSRW